MYGSSPSSYFFSFCFSFPYPCFHLNARSWVLKLESLDSGGCREEESQGVCLDGGDPQALIALTLCQDKRQMWSAEALGGLEILRIWIPFVN